MSSDGRPEKAPEATRQTSTVPRFDTAVGRPSQAPSRRDGSTPRGTASAGPGGRSVLLVDDTPANIGHLYDFLTLKGHDVSTAANGHEAIEKAKERPDIVFMDVLMPKMNGLEAIKHLRADPMTQDLYIVALTSFARDEERTNCLRAGANDYESKPVSLRRVLEMVENAPARCL